MARLLRLMSYCFTAEILYDLTHGAVQQKLSHCKSTTLQYNLKKWKKILYDQTATFPLARMPMALHNMRECALAASKFTQLTFTQGEGEQPPFSLGFTGFLMDSISHLPTTSIERLLSAITFCCPLFKTYKGDQRLISTLVTARLWLVRPAARLSA